MSTTVTSFTSAQTYTVEQGDFLSAIAQKFYGDGSEPYWQKIYDANKAVIGPDPTKLQIGMVLVIPPKDSGTVDPSNIVGQVLELVNQERSKNGLAPLNPNPQLTQSAQGHSQDMADHNFMGHNGSDGSSPFDRMHQAGYQFSFAGENVAAGYATPESVMDGWMNEAPDSTGHRGHRENILSPNYHDIGIGYAFGQATQFGRYWTQDFGTHL